MNRLLAICLLFGLNEIENIYRFCLPVNKKWISKIEITKWKYQHNANIHCLWRDLDNSWIIVIQQMLIIVIIFHPFVGFLFNLLLFIIAWLIFVVVVVDVTQYWIAKPFSRSFRMHTNNWRFSSRSVFPFGLCVKRHFYSQILCYLILQ